MREKQILSRSFYDWSLISSSYPRGLLKASPKAEDHIPAADDTGRLPASQLKNPFQGYSESLSKHMWDGTLQQTQLPASQSNRLFRSNSESLTEHPLRRHQQLPVLHQQLPILHQRPPFCTSDHLPALADTSSYQSWTSDHFPAPADTNNYQSWISDHFPAPATTSLEPATTFLHQQKPVLHQQPPIQRLQVLYQLSRPAPAIRSCSNNRHLATAIVRRMLFRFTIRHNKFWPFEATPLFCHPCLVRSQSLIF